MKKLNLQPRIYEYQFNRLSKEIEANIPQEIKSFLEEYAELGVKENRFINKDGKIFSVSMFCSYKMIHDFIKEFQQEGFNLKLPFAVDDGGWIYCISLSSQNYGIIYLHQLEMPYESEEEAFEFVVNSFEEFIDGLQPEVI